MKKKTDKIKTNWRIKNWTGTKADPETIRNVTRPLLGTSAYSEHFASSPEER